MSLYVLDSNFFIQAHRVIYPLDVVPSFWKKVKQLADRELIISIDKVSKEIGTTKDTLYDWCENNLTRNFFKDTSDVVASYEHVVKWAISRNTHYLPNATAEFLDADEADAWLIAYAHTDTENRIIVTYEVSEPLRKSKVKIPDVCLANGVQFCNTIDMFRRLGETF